MSSRRRLPVGIEIPDAKDNFGGAVTSTFGTGTTTSLPVTATAGTVLGTNLNTSLGDDVLAVSAYAMVTDSYVGVVSDSGTSFIARFHKSTDKGKTFDEGVVCINEVYDFGSAQGIVLASGSLVIVYQNSDDMKAVVSTDEGATWGSPIAVGTLANKTGFAVTETAEG